MRMIENTPPNGYTTGKWLSVLVGVETMLTTSQATEPLWLFSGKPSPRPYDSIEFALS